MQTRARILFLYLLSTAILLNTGCNALSGSPAVASNSTGSIESVPTSVVVSIPSVTPEASATPNIEDVPSHTPSATSSPLPLATETATLLPTIPPTATVTITPSITPTLPPSETPAPARMDHYVLNRPIARTSDTLIDWIDRIYPYGGTMRGQREVHLGVEFVNPRNTPVLAAADGVVRFAGMDTEQIVGPRLNYYGNLVLIEHDIQDPQGKPVSTLYGHLENVVVETGQTVSAGQRIGTVGDTGIAIGPHLHFEVRAGEPFDYQNTRNPALWIKPYPYYGTLAGRVSTTSGATPSADLILVIHSDNIVDRETTLYGGYPVNSDAAWGENFAMPDLPRGEYLLTIQEGSRVYARQNFSVYPQTTTYLELEIDS